MTKWLQVPPHYDHRNKQYQLVEPLLKETIQPCERSARDRNARDLEESELGGSLGHRCDDGLGEREKVAVIHDETRVGPRNRQNATSGRTGSNV